MADAIQFHGQIREIPAIRDAFPEVEERDREWRGQIEEFAQVLERQSKQTADADVREIAASAAGSLRSLLPVREIPVFEGTRAELDRLVEGASSTPAATTGRGVITNKVEGEN